ncbi:MAG: hydrolase Nlp/P60 [Flavobacteriaceae bacterium]|nr:hydrolase Nlp/P60 [Flavobacteriaceae bacterium]|tara:strand:+ start:469 stop:1212 length:744 start_codon:yes stop_codon:yes gene_type:complete
MQYGVCKLSIVPVRISNSDKSEMVTQLIYGDLISIIEEKENWTKIKSNFDNYIGWIDSKQYQKINEVQKKDLEIESYSSDLVEFVENEKKELITITIGSVISRSNVLNNKFLGKHITGKQSKESIVNIALLYLHTPYLWGGKTPFGIDCSGFTQMVYKINGYKLLRDSKDQATQGKTLSFIEESEPGDLAFFHNKEDVIVHVGIILKDNHIIHASGKVRIDRLDQTGIYNNDKKTHTHYLRYIKKII